MKYEAKSFTVPASAGKPETCAQVGHTEPDQRGKCLRCAAKPMFVLDREQGKTLLTTDHVVFAGVNERGFSCLIPAPSEPISGRVKP